MAANTVLHREIDEHDIVRYGKLVPASSQNHNHEAAVEALRVLL